MSTEIRLDFSRALVSGRRIHGANFLFPAYEAQGGPGRSHAGGDLVKIPLLALCLAASALVNFGATPVLAQDSPLTEYRINPGDELQVSVWREDQLQRTVTVLPDGSLSFPLVGRIEGAGRTTREIERSIVDRLASKYVDGNVPDVTVAVSKTSGLQFSVIGKVRSTGIFTPGRYVTVIEALTFAGGVDEFANLDNIVIVRKTANGTVTLPVRLSSILRGKSVSAEALNSLPVLLSGDTIIVP